MKICLEKTFCSFVNLLCESPAPFLPRAGRASSPGSAVHPASLEALQDLAELAPSEIRFIPVLPPLSLGLGQRTADALQQLAAEQDIPELRIVADLFTIALDRSRSLVDIRIRWETLRYREQQIALLLKDGHKSRNIAAELDISLETVRSGVDPV